MRTDGMQQEIGSNANFKFSFSFLSGALDRMSEKEFSYLVRKSFVIVLVKKKVQHVPPDQPREERAFSNASKKDLQPLELLFQRALDSYTKTLALHFSLFNFSKLTITAIIRIPKQHLRILHIKHRIRHICIPARHAALHNHHMLALPRMQHRHSRNRAPRLHRNRIYRVVGANYQRDVGVREVVVDLVHFEHNVVGHRRFGEENVALAWHAAGDGVDGETNVDAL